MSSTNQDLDQHINGRTFASGISASVQTLLTGVGKRVPVHLRGEEFVNYNFWPMRILVTRMCEWAKENPEKTPTRKEIAGWCEEANSKESVRNAAYIILPQIPQKLPRQRALAYEGGAYHEACHSLYSKNDKISAQEVETISDFILEMWGAVDDWSPYASMMGEIWNLIEDVYIERLLAMEFPSTYPAMVTLNDFVLRKEKESVLKVQEEVEGYNLTPLTVVRLTFRLYGKGYMSPTVMEAVEWYKECHYDAWAFVCAPDSLMRSVLEEAIGDVSTPAKRKAYKQDQMLSFRLAMKFMATADHMIKKFKFRIEHGPCEHCGAPANKIGYAPSTKKGHLIRICTECGAQDEVPQPPDMQNLLSQGQTKDVLVDIEHVGDRPFWINSPMSGDAESGRHGEGEEEAEGSASVEGSADAEGTGGEGTRGPVRLTLPVSIRSRDFEPESESGETGPSDPDFTVESSAGGYGSEQDYEKHGIDFEAFSAVNEREIKSDPSDDDVRTSDHQMLKAQEALEAEFRKMKEDRERALGSGERYFHPYTTEYDTAAFVSGNVVTCRDNANKLIESVVDESAALRARFRAIFRSLSVKQVTHGHRRGRKLSGRRLVDSVLAIQGGEYPDRPYKKVTSGIDTSVSAAIVIDESGSMGGILKEATQMMVALAEPLDQIGGKVLACGIRDSHIADSEKCYPEEVLGDYFNRSEVFHRCGAVHVDVFQNFNERFNAVSWRYSRTLAEGGTPLADGVQYALNALSDRTEQFRFLFVITDGVPNNPHEEVIKYQCRLARKIGIYVIGIGVGHGSQYVEGLFDDHVFDPHVENIPRKLIAKLNEIADKARLMRRGQKMLSTSAPS